MIVLIRGGQVNSLKLDVVKNENTGVFDVFIDGINFGVFDSLRGSNSMCYFPKRNDLLTGDHYILIGEKLNEMNMVKR